MNKRVYDKVYTDREEFLQAQAAEHTIANMAMDHLIDEVYDIQDALQQLREEHASAEISNITQFGQKRLTGAMEGEAHTKALSNVDQEMKSWREQAEKDLAKLEAKGLPWTLRNSQSVFHER